MCKQCEGASEENELDALLVIKDAIWAVRDELKHANELREKEIKLLSETYEVVSRGMRLRAQVA